MIQGRSVPNSLPIAPNAKLKSRRERQFITGHHHTKCFAQIVAMQLTVSFSLRWLMKRSIPAKEIHMHGKFKRRGNPLFWSSADGRFAPQHWNALINIFTFLMVHPSH